MRRDSLAFALSGVVFGLLVGWMIGTQQVPDTPEPVAASAPAPPAAGAPEPPPPLDQGRASTLEQQAAANPSDADVRGELGALYLNAERFDQAASWYEQALELEPDDTGASTDLAIAYFYMGQTDRALAQLDRALAVNPRFPKALLHQGSIRAFGKQDLAGAAESWERLVAAAPDSPEAGQARQGLTALRAAHEGTAGPGAPAGQQP